jgi:hypothetical protein
MTPNLRQWGHVPIFNPLAAGARDRDTTRQLVMMLADCICEAGYMLDGGRVTEMSSGQTLHAFAAAHPRTGEVWCVTGPDDFEALAELVRQIDLECDPAEA